MRGVISTGSRFQLRAIIYDIAQRASAPLRRSRNAALAGAAICCGGRPGSPNPLPQPMLALPRIACGSKADAV